MLERLLKLLKISILFLQYFLVTEVSDKTIETDFRTIEAFWAEWAYLNSDEQKTSVVIFLVKYVFAWQHEGHQPLWWIFKTGFTWKPISKNLKTKKLVSNLHLTLAYPFQKINTNCFCLPNFYLKVMLGIPTSYKITLD